MNEFLAVAKSLEIKELCNAETEPDNEPSPSDPVTSTENMREETSKPDQIKMHAPQPQERQRRVVSVNGKYECDQCNKTYSGSGSLHNHKKSAHQGVKYACDQCDYQATQQSDLTVHIQSKHEGIKYACDQCEFQATRKTILTTQIKNNHK